MLHPNCRETSWVESFTYLDILSLKKVMFRKEKLYEKTIKPNVKADDLRAVDFCWYNSFEAPLYFDVCEEEWI